MYLARALSCVLCGRLTWVAGRAHAGELDELDARIARLEAGPAARAGSAPRPAPAPLAVQESRVLVGKPCYPSIKPTY